MKTFKGFVMQTCSTFSFNPKTNDLFLYDIKNAPPLSEDGVSLFRDGSDCCCLSLQVACGSGLDAWQLHDCAESAGSEHAQPQPWLRPRRWKAAAQVRLAFPGWTFQHPLPASPQLNKTDLDRNTMEWSHIRSPVSVLFNEGSFSESVALDFSGQTRRTRNVYDHPSVWADDRFRLLKSRVFTRITAGDSNQWKKDSLENIWGETHAAGLFF